MKIKISLLFVLMLAITSCNSTKEPKSKEETYKKQIEFAEKFVNDFMETLKQGSTYDFTDKATPEFLKGMTPSYQKTSYEEILNNFGEMKQMEYHEIQLGVNQEGLKMIRFKGDFKKQYRGMEVRVVLNKEDLITGFYIIPWDATLKQK